MARNNEKIVLLLTEKLGLLETFIFEQTRLAKKYHWKMSKEETMNLTRIVDKLGKVTEQIDRAIRE